MTTHSSTTPSPASAARPRSRRGRSLLVVGLLGLALVAAGCGGGGYYYDDTGDAYVDNQDAFATVGFYMAPSGTGAWTGNLLGDWLFPGEVAYVGSFVEDYYDADAEQQDGATIQFTAEPIYAGEATTFVVF
ncbi:MAG: hypothetical protein AB7T63_12340 [Planctomycetota bacterium]